jgi:hypothetical protein
MHIGKLYRFEDEQFVVDINYQLLGGTPTNLWGELVPVEYACIGGGEDYMLELEDDRKIKCNLKKKVNRAVIGIPPRFIYHFMGRTLLG